MYILLLVTFSLLYDDYGGFSFGSSFSVFIVLPLFFFSFFFFLSF